MNSILLNKNPSSKWPLLIMGGSLALQGIQAAPPGTTAPLTSYSPECSIVSAAWSAMGGSPAINSTNCCNVQGTFYGVFCDSSSPRKVVQITWDSKSLKGSITPILSNLTNLNTLALHNNQLNGSIPSILGKLRSMQVLYLGGNQLTGAIPSELGNLPGLYTLSLSSNKLSGSIPNLSNATWLRQIYLNDNQLTGTIPSSLGNLQLNFLHLENNQLSGTIPSTLASLNYVQEIWLYNNKLSGYPSSLNASNVLSLILFPNPMSTIPYDKVVNVSSIVLTNATWTTFLNTPVLLKKRQGTSSSGNVSLSDLLKLCDLNNVQSSLVPAGCVAGVYNAYCINPANATLLKQCQTAYDQAIGASIFSSLGVCAAWKQGPLTSSCATAIKGFTYNYVAGKDSFGQNVYVPLNSTHAGDFVKSILGSKTYAPCPYAFPTCNWSTYSKT